MTETAFTIEVDDSELTEWGEELKHYPALVRTAAARAANRAATWAKTRIVDQVSLALGIKKSDIDGKWTHRNFGGVFVSHKAKPEEGEAYSEVSINGARVPLFRFSGQPAKPPTLEGISYTIGAGAQFHNAFTAVMASGHIGFFKRIAGGGGGGKHKWLWTHGHWVKSGSPIQELLGPSIPHVAEESADFKKLVSVDAHDYFSERMDHELGFIFSTGKLGPEESGNGGGNE